MNLIAAFDGAVRKHSDKTFLRSGDVSTAWADAKVVCDHLVRMS
jgi:hypothetical protein